MLLQQVTNLEFNLFELIFFSAVYNRVSFMFSVGGLEPQKL